MNTSNIDYIVKHGTTEQMEGLRDLLIQLVNESDSQATYEYCIHILAHGNHLSEEIARHWVDCMENGDGTKGPHWSAEQTSQVLRDKNYKFNTWDWYAALNMVYSDYYNSKFDTPTYIELARQWLDDKDMPKDKIVRYYYFVKE